MVKTIYKEYPLKDCSKHKIKAYVGFIIIAIMYGYGKYNKGAMSDISLINMILLIFIVFFMLVLSLKLALPYIKCIDENKKRFKKFK